MIDKGTGRAGVMAERRKQKMSENKRVRQGENNKTDKLTNTKNIYNRQM